MPPRDLKLEALAGILSCDIRVNVHCYRAGDIAAVLTIAREFGFRVGAIHHATEAYKIPGLLREAGTCAAVWADWWGFKLEAQDAVRAERSEEHTSELQSLMRISYAVFCLTKTKTERSTYKPANHTYP